MASSSSTVPLGANPHQNNYHPVNGNAVNQQPPQRQPSGPPVSNNGTETRLKIVEILANTANGCLAELGYFPGMSQKLAELEKRNKTWQSENVQLYQDNQTLLMKLQEQEHRLKLVQAPEAEKVAKIVQLERDVQRLRAQRDELKQGKPATPAPNTPDFQALYRKLHADYTSLCEAYRVAYSEVHHYRAQVGLQPYAPLAPIPQNVQNVQAMTRVHPAPVVPSHYPPTPTGHQAQGPPPQPPSQPGAALTNQHAVVQSPVAISPSHSILQQGRGRPNEQIQIQHPYGQIRQQGPGSNPPSRRSSMAAPPPHPLHQVPTQAFVSPNVVDPPVRPFSTPPPPAISRIARQQHPPPLAQQYAQPMPIQTTQIPPTQSPQNAVSTHDQQQAARRASNPNTPVNGVYPPNLYPPSAFHPTARRNTSQPLPSSGLRSGSEPLSISTNHDPNYPPTPSADYPPPPMSASAILSQSSPFAPPHSQQSVPPASSIVPIQTILPTPPQSAEQNGQPAVTTMAPYDMLLKKPPFVAQQQQQQQVFDTPQYTPPTPQHSVSGGTPLQSYSRSPSMRTPSSSRSSTSGTPIPAGAVSGGTPVQNYSPYPPVPGPSRSSSTPPVAFSAPVVSPAPVVVPSAPPVAPLVPAVVPSDPPPVVSLKRDSISMADGHGREEEAQKKPRLESPVSQPELVQPAPSHAEPQTSIPPPSSPAAVPPASSPPPPASSPVPAPAEAAQVTTDLPPPAQDDDQEMEDEEEGEGLVEVGPDGLRLVKDCLEDLFDEDEELPGHRTCRLCSVRHRKGLISEPPTAFVNATDEELEAHCLAEHDQVWEVLRKIPDGIQKVLHGVSRFIPVRKPDEALPGPILLDGFLQSFLLGTIVNQAFKYWVDYRDDSWRRRIFVTSVIILSILQTMLEDYKVWRTLIIGKRWSTSRIEWSDLFLNGCICWLCEGFYIKRCWKMMDRSMWVLAPLSVLSILIMAANVYLLFGCHLNQAIAMGIAFRSLEGTDDTLTASHFLLPSTIVAFSFWIFGSLILETVVTVIRKSSDLRCISTPS
ncbi:unnamed protein product [Cyclocybe aegerita]|uniref:Uncharacterized protein n=1 Tax=Cyclocybe aegerita TaxID=1973307 RepID=A0A8S0VQD9_CYCAE|nr:unnamed protein product [Cyclocybe aegerita]